jgi:predicted metal-binding membrane protein
MTGTVERALLPALIGGSSAAAWIAMWRFGESPWGHGHAAHGVVAEASLLWQASLFLATWITMTVAMMLPTTTPLVLIFRRLTAARPDRSVLVLLLIAGYLAAWAACGLLVFGAIRTIRFAAAGSAWLAGHPSTPVSALFLIAGAFQFSRLKYRCLDECRSPLSFVTSRWRGVRERWNSFRLGAEHGAFCVGCCWALMLLMFAAGATSLLWMATLGGVMAIEKNVTWGRRVSAPVGIVLLVSGALVALLPSGG